MNPEALSEDPILEAPRERLVAETVAHHRPGDGGCPSGGRSASGFPGRSSALSSRDHPAGAPPQGKPTSRTAGRLQGGLRLCRAHKSWITGRRRPRGRRDFCNRGKGMAALAGAWTPEAIVPARRSLSGHRPPRGYRRRGIEMSPKLSPAMRRSEHKCDCASAARPVGRSGSPRKPGVWTTASEGRCGHTRVVDAPQCMRSGVEGSGPRQQSRLAEVLPSRGVACAATRPGAAAHGSDAVRLGFVGLSCALFSSAEPSC